MKKIITFFTLFFLMNLHAMEEQGRVSLLRRRKKVQQLQVTKGMNRIQKVAAGIFALLGASLVLGGAYLTADNIHDTRQTVTMPLDYSWLRSPQFKDCSWEIEPPYKISDCTFPNMTIDDCQQRVSKQYRQLCKLCPHKIDGRCSLARIICGKLTFKPDECVAGAFAMMFGTLTLLLAMSVGFFN